MGTVYVRLLPAISKGGMLWIYSRKETFGGSHFLPIWSHGLLLILDAYVKLYLVFSSLSNT